MCSTRSARPVEGAAEIDINFSAELCELTAGLFWTCQAKPSTERLVVDYDHV